MKSLDFPGYKQALCGLAWKAGGRRASGGESGWEQSPPVLAKSRARLSHQPVGVMREELCPD